MIQAARMYYEQDLTQSQVAKEMGISRPLVSMLLSEAKACGIVTIHIREVDNAQELAEKRLEALFPGTRFVVVADKHSSDKTDDALAQVAYDRCFQGKNSGRNIGIGWGSMLSRVANCGHTGNNKTVKGTVFPLVGGIKATYRGYHTNEITRIVAQTTGLEANYLYLPAFLDSSQDLNFIRQMEEYKSIEERWKTMDTALVSISNYPSYPDLGVEYRYGNQLTKKGAVGRILAHYYNSEGIIIHPQVDNVMQLPLEQLKATPNVIAVCSTLLRPQSILGALRLGVVNTLIVSFGLAQSILEETE